VRRLYYQEGGRFTLNRHLCTNLRLKLGGRSYHQHLQLISSEGFIGGGYAFAYLPEPSAPGRDLPHECAPRIAPDTEYAMRIGAENSLEFHATTLTPSRIHIAELALMDDNIEQKVRQLRLFGEGEGYATPANPLEYAVACWRSADSKPGHILPVRHIALFAAGWFERGWSSIVARNEWADLWLFGFTSD